MPQEIASPIVTFITWKSSYDCIVNIINCQHQGILRFINTWYNDVYHKRIPSHDPREYMQKKFSFLELFSETHFGFEDTLLQILTEKFNFPQDVYAAHMDAHSKFISTFMRPLEAQVEMSQQAGALDMVDNIAADALRDVAKWWYTHIRDASDPAQHGHDHLYRIFVERLPEKDKVTLFNELIMYLERSPQQFSCTHW
jgi:hypothetical protein